MYGNDNTYTHVNGRLGAFRTGTDDRAFRASYRAVFERYSEIAWFPSQSIAEMWVEHERNERRAKGTPSGPRKVA